MYSVPPPNRWRVLEKTHLPGCRDFDIPVKIRSRYAPRKRDHAREISSWTTRRVCQTLFLTASCRSMHRRARRQVARRLHETAGLRDKTITHGRRRDVCTLEADSANGAATSP